MQLLPLHIDKLRRPEAGLLHLVLRCSGPKRHLVIALEPPMAGPVWLDGAPAAGTTPHPSQAMLRKGLGAPWVELRRAPGLWELVLADGSVLCVSWRRKTRGVWWQDEPKLAPQSDDAFELERRSLVDWEAARQSAKDEAWRRDRKRRLERQIHRLWAQLSQDDAEELRALGTRAAALRDRVERGDGQWLIPDFDPSVPPTPLRESMALSVSALVDRIFHRARRAERRSVAAAEQIERIEAELESLAGQQAPEAERAGPSKDKSDNLPKGVRSFPLSSGRRLLVGRDAEANHAVTFRLGRGRDLWFHLRDGPGSHVLMPLGRGEEADMDHQLAGAALALHYSSARGDRAEVRVAFRRDLEAVPGQPGKALVKKEKSLLIDPRDGRVQQALERLGLRLALPS